jgi:hypothetical protein
LEGIASTLLYDNVEDMIKGNGIDANDVVAVVLLSIHHEQGAPSVCYLICAFPGKNFAKALHQ